MQPVFIHSCLESPKLPEFLIESGGLTNKTYKGLVKPEFLTDEENEIMEAFCRVLNLNPTNYGVSIFGDNKKHQYLASPAIGLNSQGVAGLLIGTDQKENDEFSDFLPLEFIPNAEKPTEDEDIIEYHGVYKLGRLTCTLTYVPSPFDQHDLKAYVAVATRKHIFHIPFRVQKDTPNEVIDLAWRQGDFSDILTSFYREQCKYTTMFGHSFSQDIFPNSGVVLILTKGEAQTKMMDSGSGKMVERKSSMWTLHHTTHPELLVTTTKGELVRLGDIGIIYFSETTSPTKALQKWTGNQFFLHVEGAAYQGEKRRIDWSPYHFGTVMDILVNDYASMFSKEVHVFKQLQNVNGEATLRRTSGSAVKQTAQLQLPPASIETLEPTEAAAELIGIAPSVISKPVQTTKAAMIPKNSVEVDDIPF